MLLVDRTKGSMVGVCIGIEDVAVSRVEKAVTVT